MLMLVFRDNSDNIDTINKSVDDKNSIPISFSYLVYKIGINDI